MKGKGKRKRKSISTIHLLLLVDTGGQPQFQEILPNFVKANINLLVHNLSQTLAHCPKFNYVIDGKEFEIPETMQTSNLAIIEQSVRSITSVPCKRSAMPHIAIIGTFKDKCNSETPDYNEMLKRKSAEITECLKPYINNKCGIISHYRKEQIIFDIDGSEGGWGKNGDCLQTLKGFITRCAKETELEVPLKYFVFLEILKAYAKVKDIHFITLDTCKEIARDADISMNDSDVKECLVIFNDFNLVLYFPEIIENLVFIKPNFLFRTVTDLIVASFHCKNHDTIQGEREKFHKTGIFTDHLLQHTLKLVDKNFTPENLLTLLKGLFIIAEVEHGKYFMPCVLSTQTDVIDAYLKEISESMEENHIEGPLIISFYYGMSPRGIFCALIVFLAKRPYWRLCRDKTFHRTLFEFEIYPQSNRFSAPLGKVILVDMNSHIDIYTTCEDNYCSDIRQIVQYAFMEACDNMSYSLEDLGVEYGLPCNKGSRDERHSTSISYNDNQKQWMEKCSVCKEVRPNHLMEKRAVWFSEGDSSSSKYNIIEQ